MGHHSTTTHNGNKSYFSGLGHHSKTTSNGNKLYFLALGHHSETTNNGNKSYFLALGHHFEKTNNGKKSYFFGALLRNHKQPQQIVLLSTEAPLRNPTNNGNKSYFLVLGHHLETTSNGNKSYFSALGHHSQTTNNGNKSYFLALGHHSETPAPTPPLGEVDGASLGGSFWAALGRNKSYCRVLVAFSCPRLAVTNRTAESRWLFLLAGLGFRIYRNCYGFGSHLGSMFVPCGQRPDFGTQLCSSLSRVSVCRDGGLDSVIICAWLLGTCS